MQKIILFCNLLLLPFLINAKINIPHSVDSISYSALYLNAQLAASYTEQRNWTSDDHSVISFTGCVDIRKRLMRASGWEHNHSFHTEISYMQLADSLWMKNSDYARLKLQWNSSYLKKINYSYSVYLGTQWLNSWKYRLTESGYRKEWAGGILNPATMELSYGFNKNIWKNSNLNLSFVTVKINTIARNPELTDSLNEKDNSLFITKHSYIKSSYGFSAQLYIYEELYNKLILVENDSRLFFNALNKNAVNLNFNQRIAIRFLKYMQLRFDLKLIYNPDYSNKLQYRQEVLLGIFYEHHYQHAR